MTLSGLPAAGDPPQPPDVWSWLTCSTRSTRPGRPRTHE